MLLKKNFFLFLFLGLVTTTKTIAQDNQAPAEAIIKKVISLKKENTQSNFKQKSYNKLIITANPEIVEGNIDTVFTKRKGEKIIKEIDSSDYKFKKIIAKQHLYQTEKISILTSSGKHKKEEILSTKMAGFKEPIYEYFSLQLQPFSVYADKYILVEQEYTSPISAKGLKKYSYKYLGQDQIEDRKVDKIAFKSKKTGKKENLEGLLYIDSEKNSVAKLVLKVNGKLKIVSTHSFSFKKEIDNWFSSRSVLSVKKGTSKHPIKIFGETITFEGTNEKLNPFNKKYASDFLEIKSQTDYFDTQFKNDKITKKHIAIEVKTNNSNRLISWNLRQKDSLDTRSNPTYVSLDSLIERRKIENKIKIGRKIIKGYYPVGFFDFDLRYLARYNNYEGFRLGLGGMTNEKFSKRFKLEGYFVYGTKDGNFKGYLANSFKLHRPTETWLGISYRDDVSEIANTAIEIDKKTFKIYDPRPFNLSTFYNHETWRGFLESKIIPKTDALFQISQSFIEPKFNYQYQLNNVIQTDFYATLATASFQWNPFSKYMQTPNGIQEINKNYPKITFQFSKSIPDLWKNSYDFGKLDFRMDYQYKFNFNHKISFLFEGGYAFGDTPLTHLYNHSPNNLTKDRILQRITFAGKDSFETMYFNEFFSDKYLYLHFKHQLPKWNISRQIKPVLSLVSRYGIGELKNKERHLGFDFKTLEQGFYESGFEMNQIFKGIGFTAFYRYGPNQLVSFEDNIAIKLSVQINLGLNN